jgi:hypothetical protein
MKPVAPITPNYRRVFSIPEIPDMQSFIGWVLGKKLNCNGRNQAKTDDQDETKKPLFESRHNELQSFIFFGIQ